MAAILPTSNAVANQAIFLVGDNTPPVTGNSPTFDNSTAGKALQRLYPWAVQTVGREFGWDFARSFVALTLTGNAAPFGFAYEYGYPAGVQLWQLCPASITDANDPLPVNWSVGNAVVSSVAAKVIWTDLASAGAYFNGMPVEATWDPGFQEAVVRLLASELALAIKGKPALEQQLLQSGASFESIAEGRSD